jgi:hypothetical protein
MMEEWFMKLPPLPQQARDTLVSIMPWIVLIFGILGVIGGIAGLGLVSTLSPLLLISEGMLFSGGTFIVAVLGIVSAVLLLIAYPDIKARKQKGWNLLFWSEIVSVVGAVLSWSPFGVLMTLVGLYLLFQIKPAYR